LKEPTLRPSTHRTFTATGPKAGVSGFSFWLSVWFALSPGRLVVKAQGTEIVLPIKKGTVTTIVGKGGTGKTTLSGLLVRSLLVGKCRPILAIDADPARGFERILGVRKTETLGGIREELLGPKSRVPAGVAKKSYLDLRVQSAIAESSGFDLLTMGRPEGPGCYCYVNNLLRGSLDALVENYPWVVIDSEAGMEHLSRRTAKDVDYLFVVCNGSIGSFDTAAQILDLIEELRTRVTHKILILNNLTEHARREERSLLERVDTGSFETVGRIPYDPEVETYERMGRALTELPADRPAVLALEEILSEVAG